MRKKAQKKTIGFLGKPDSPNKPENETASSYKPLYEFDSGLTVSIEEANHNLIALGGTGRGKTSTYILPMAWRLIEEGFGGLIIDVKNNFSKTVRKIAHSCGRSKDIIEIGSHDSAMPVNILDCADLEIMLQVIESIIIDNVATSKNVDWYLKGVRSTQECAQVLYFLNQAKPEYGLAPSLALLSKMIDDVEFAHKVWKKWLLHMDENDHRQVTLKNEVLSDAFHVMNPPQKKSVNSRQIEEWERQVTWRLSMPRKFLGEFARGSLADNLSANNSMHFDLEDLIFKQNKIVLLRFSSTTGGPGKRMGSMVKELFYRTVYTRFDRKESDQYVFAVMDEFQDIISLDESSSLDDFGWFSKAREFKVINIVATQGLSSLYRSGLENRVNALISNFGVKIILQTDDPGTHKWSQIFKDSSIPVQDLGAAEALVAKFALPKRKLAVSVEKAQAVHDSVSRKLTEITFIDDCKENRKSMDWSNIIKMFDRPDWTLDSNELARVYELYPTSFSENSLVHLGNDHPGFRESWGHILETVAREARNTKTVITNFKLTNDRCQVACKNSIKAASRLRQIANDMKSKCCPECGLLRSSATEAFACCNFDMGPFMPMKLEIYEKYKDYLDENLICSLSLPGWQGLVEESLDSLIDVSSNTKILSISEENNALNIEAKLDNVSSEHAARVKKILENAKKKSSTTCCCCGENILGKKQAIIPPLCTGCRISRQPECKF